MWRGRALADFGHEAWARHEINRLEELRLGARCLRVEADLLLVSGGWNPVVQLSRPTTTRERRSSAHLPLARLTRPEVRDWCPSALKPGPGLRAQSA